LPSPAGEHHVSTVLGENESGSPADSRTAASYHGNLSFQGEA
jgi:hypothetical protein